MSEKSVENFPYEYKELDSDESKELLDYMPGFISNVKFVRIGPKGYFFLDGYLDYAASIYNMPVKSDDVFVVTFPKSGTTWTQDLVWLLKNDLDFERAKTISLNKRFLFLEGSTFKPAMPVQCATEEMEAVRKSLFPLTITEVKEMPSPRLIKTHLPLSLLPSTLLDNTKVVYVARDPRDVAVSFFHHNKLMRIMEGDEEFKPYWNYFIKDMVPWSPYFEHLLEAWAKRNHQNLLFLFYEDLLKDLPEGIRRVAKFLDKELTEKDVANLTEHLTFDNFKNNKSVNMEEFQQKGVFRSDGGFVRKGKKGGWREYFDEEMTAQAEKWIEDNIRGTDFRFPHME